MSSPTETSAPAWATTGVPPSWTPSSGRDFPCLPQLALMVTSHRCCVISKLWYLTNKFVAVTIKIFQACNAAVEGTCPAKLRLFWVSNTNKNAHQRMLRTLQNKCFQKLLYNKCARLTKVQVLHLLTLLTMLKQHIYKTQHCNHTWRIINWGNLENEISVSI